METLAYIEIIDIDWGFLIEVLLFINFETNNQPNRMRLNGGPADIHSVDWYFTLFYILLGINGNIGRTQKIFLIHLDWRILRTFYNQGNIIILGYIEIIDIDWGFITTECRIKQPVR